MKRWIALAAAVAAVGSAHAAVTITFLGAGIGHGVTVSGTVFNGTVHAGLIRWHAAALGGNFATVCADLTNFVANPQVVNVLNSSAGSAGVQRAASIVGAHFQSVTNADQAAALQLAVWEAIYDGGATFNAAAGNTKFGASATVLALASSYYNAYDDGLTSIYLKPNFPPGGQAQLYAVPGPAALVMPLAWFGAAMAKRRRKSA